MQAQYSFLSALSQVPSQRYKFTILALYKLRPAWVCGVVRMNTQEDSDHPLGPLGLDYLAIHSIIGGLAWVSDCY